MSSAAAAIAHYQPTLQTLACVTLFLIGYIAWLLKHTSRDAMDLYDFLILSSVAVVPAGFVFFPGLSHLLTRAVGVLFPFVLLFSALFFIVFVALHRLILRIARLEGRTRKAVQELALLRERQESEPGDGRARPG